MTINNTRLSQASSTTLQTFSFAPGVALRSITKDSEPWFVAADVCGAIGLQNTSDAIKALDEDERDRKILGNQTVNIISEAGLYRLVMRSTKPAAKGFQKWVTATVLPTIRRSGLYILGQEKPITDDLTLPELLAQIAATQAKVDAINAAKVCAWSRHQEEKNDRYAALRFLRGSPGRRPCVKQAQPSVPKKLPGRVA
jgi:prophage antirepressor-like protein